MPLGKSGGLLENRPEKAAFVTQDTAIVFGQLERGNALGIRFRTLAVVFIGCEAREGEHGQGDVVGTFRGQKVAMMLAAELLYQRDPDFGIGLEFGQLVRANSRNWAVMAAWSL